MHRSAPGHVPSVKAMRMEAMESQGWRTLYGRPEGIVLRTATRQAIVWRDGSLEVKTAAGVLYIASDDTQGFADWIGT